MKIVGMNFYGGARKKVCRLGLSHLFLELQEIMIETKICVFNKKKANGAAVAREMIDAQFFAAGEWKQKKSGGIDWIKRIRYNDSIISRIGVELQVSGRSEMLARDIVHIRNDLQDSIIDIGVIIVPSDELAPLLTDRVASFSYAKKYVEVELREAKTFPMILMGIEHDGFSDEPLPKKRTNLGKETPS